MCTPYYSRISNRCLNLKRAKPLPSCTPLNQTYSFSNLPHLSMLFLYPSRSQPIAAVLDFSFSLTSTAKQSVCCDSSTLQNLPRIPSVFHACCRLACPKYHHLSPRHSNRWISDLRASLLYFFIHFSYNSQSDFFPKNVNHIK